MDDLLRVSIVQTDLIWGDVDANLQIISNKLSCLKSKTDLIVLPEMFSSGFMMENKAEIAPKAKFTIDWMINQSKELNATILGSIIVEEKGQYYNRLLCTNSEGIISSYDKRHLFRMGEEQLHFSAGNAKVIFNIGKWRIRPLVCYDLRFPVWSRNTNDYDLLLYVANWPEARRDVWKTLLKARALENLSYTVGVNRIGKDGMGLSYAGDSVLLDARGKELGKCSEYSEEIQTVELDLTDLQKFRAKFPVHLDADSFQIS